MRKYSTPMVLINMYGLQMRLQISTNVKRECCFVLAQMGTNAEQLLR